MSNGIAAYCKLDNKTSRCFVDSLNNKVRVIHQRAYGPARRGYLRLKILTCMLPALKNVQNHLTRFPEGRFFTGYSQDTRRRFQGIISEVVLWAPRNGNTVVCATKAEVVSYDFAGPLEMEKLSSTRPYLLRAFYAWIVDNQLTPHLIVDTTRPGVVIPPQYVKDGRIILNISPAAVHGLKIDNISIEFSGRFGGTAYGILVPLTAVEAIYSKENGKGMVFAPEPDTANRPAPQKPVLKLIK